VDHLVDSDIKDLKLKSNYLLLANSIALPILLWVWFSVVRMVKHHIEIREQMEERLREQSIRDGLTGLLNRRGFLVLAQQEMKTVPRTGKTVGILYADLDNLKQINDQFSHKEGDRALVETAQLLEECFRITDIQGRLGGDEFAIFISGAGRDELRIMVERFYKAIETANTEKMLPFRLSVSVGVGFCEPENPKTIEDLLALADADMYEQKRKKKSGNPA
jgi:diguanylate cyclase (GGDEF)-like protein